MEENQIYGIVFALVGAFAIIASIANWDFFINNYKAKFVLKLFGRNGTRIFYSIFGIALLVLGYLSVTGKLIF